MIIICVKPLCMKIIYLIICIWYMDVLYMMKFVLKIKNPVEGEIFFFFFKCIVLWYHVWENFVMWNVDKKERKKMTTFYLRKFWY